MAKLNQTASREEPSKDANEITITAPAVDADGNVLRAGDPGPMVPAICHVEGTFNYTPDYQLDGIKVLSIKYTGTGDPYPSNDAEVEAVTSSSDAVDVPSENIDTENGTWFIDASVIANLDNDPTSSTRNHISVVALVTLINAMGDPLPASARLAHHNFNAVGVDSCSEMAQSSRQRIEKAKASHLSPLILPALDVTDGWIRYSFFSLSGQQLPVPPVNGFVLGLPGCCNTPLTAREVAVAACHVDWRPRPGRHLVITKPHGILDTSPFDGSTSRRMQFDGLPKFSLVVHQLRSGPEDPIRIPVDSDCREHPSRIRLNPAKPIYVQVNNVQADRTKSDGILTFWVKVLC